jgi:hypothetical protein
MASRDSITGHGKFQDAFVEYNRNGWQSYLGYTSVESKFNPRLGFFPDRNFQGWDVGAHYNKNFDQGFLNDYGFFVGGLTYRRVDGPFYRDELTANVFTTIRNGPAITGMVVAGEFEGTKDRLYRLNVGFPRGNPYRNVSFDYQWGEQAGIDYRSLSLSGAYRTLGRLQTNLRFQRVEYGETMDQVILSGNYDLGKDQSISGRMVHIDNDTNFYVAFKKAGNLGAEYFLILGDPNARAFRASLILKVTIPFEIPLGHALSNTTQGSAVKIS